MTSSKTKKSTPVDAIAKLDEACNTLVSNRETPLLVLYYTGGYSSMSEDDLESIYTAFRGADLKPEEKLPALDVLIESYGGDPTAGYRIAQLIRDFADEVSFLVAEHAYSAATLMCFSGNEVRLAHYVGLSPIDITLVWHGEQEVELASIDSFLDFSVRAREKMEELFQRREIEDAQSTVESDLLMKMVEEVGALVLGSYYRTRNLTGRYAEELLGSVDISFHGSL
jgi:hypothetical protein